MNDKQHQKILAVLLSLILVLATGVVTSFAEVSPSAAAASVTGVATNSAINSPAAPAVTTPSAAVTGQFTDISGHWAESIIKEAAALKITGGYPDGTYLPDNLIKREEFFKLLTNIMTTVPDTTNTRITFRDVVDYEWYVPTIKTAVAAGITSGYGDGTFGIGMMISRQEAAKVAGSVIPATNLDYSKGVASALDKDQIADWAYDYVDLMFKKGYMKGDTEGNFRPTTALTRAEAATILLNIKKNETVIAGNAGAVTVPQQTTTPAAVTTPGALSGTGSKNDPYVISTAADLDKVRDSLTGAAFFVLNKDISITTDLAEGTAFDEKSKSNWSDGNFTPIGSKEEPFTGYFDGKGHTIEGLDIQGQRKESGNLDTANYAGLFGYLAEGSVVENLMIENSKIKGQSNTGAIAGFSEGTIENCTVASDVDVTGDNQTGGIVGRSEGILKGNTNKADVVGSGTYTGGIAGIINQMGTILSDCENQGRITGNDNTGGIAGMITSAGSATVADCSNSGKVISETANAGGIAGSVNYSGVTIEGCHNSGTITSRNTGGIAGYNKGAIESCYNTGSINGSNYAGGITATQSEKGSKVYKCYNSGAIYSSNNAGGIVGSNDSRISYCYNTGKIDGSTNTGGITGKNTDSIWNVYNAGKVTGDTGTGALTGRNAGEIDWSFWLDGTCDFDTGLNDSGSSKTAIKKLTADELSGQQDVKVVNEEGSIITILNTGQDETIWKLVSGDTYLYPQLVQ